MVAPLQGAVIVFEGVSGRMADGGIRSRRATLGFVPPARGGREAGAPSGSSRAPKLRFRLTRRTTILPPAVRAVVDTIAYLLQEDIAQCSRLAAIDARNAALDGKVTSLQQQISVWNGPGYVAIHARSQLHYVLPGEEDSSLPGTTIGSEQTRMPAPTASSWCDTLWGTVRSPGPDSSAGPSARR